MVNEVRIETEAPERTNPEKSRGKEEFMVVEYIQPYVTQIEEMQHYRLTPVVFRK